MSRMLYCAEKLLEWLCLCTGLFSLAVLIILRVYEIFSRNVLGESSQWFDFAESEAFLLLVFLSLAYAYTRDAHVRVDVFYASFARRTRSILNVTGTVAFGLPLCWLILLRGMWEKTSLINSPMFNFETSMSGFGMYVKYLMAAFLIVFALSMLFQFTATLFSALADIDENVEDDPVQDTGVEG